MSKHDDFCPCTRFSCDEIHCSCGAVETRQIIEDASKSFARRLSKIMDKTHTVKPAWAEQA